MTDNKKIPAKDGYGMALVELCKRDKRVIVLDADVAKSTRTEWVKEQVPEQFLTVGISEQDMVGTAAGLSLTGMIPFATTYSVFLTGRGWEQIRNTVCYQNLNVKLGGAHCGVSVGPDGGTHQALEDVALMRVLPHMTVVVPCDVYETYKATMAIAEIEGPCFIRFGREATPVVTDEKSPFTLGKANLLKEGKDVGIIANGCMVHEALKAREELSKEGISAAVVNMHTVKPLDEKCVVELAKGCGCLVTAEEHQKVGGLGSAVCETVLKNRPVPVEFVGVDDRFGQSGSPEELMVEYGLTAADIVRAAKRAMERKIIRF